MAQREVKHYKLNSLPATPEKGAIYYIPNGNGTDVDQYITDKDGTSFIFVGRIPASVAISISAGVQSGTAAQLIFSNQNNVTFGYDSANSVITASVAPGGGGGSAMLGMLNIGNTSGTTGTNSSGLILAGGNNITLSQQTGVAANTIYISAPNIPSTTQFQHSSLMTNYLGTDYTSHTHDYLGTTYTTHTHDYLGTTYTSHTHPEYVNTSQSSLLRHTSADSQLQFTSQMSDYLGTGYTTHTHSQYVNTSQSSLFQQTSQMTDYLGTTYTTHTHPAQVGISSVALSDTTYTSGQISFRDGNGVSWASTTGQGISLTHGLQHTSNTSNITSNAVNTSQSSLFQHTSATSAITSNALNTSQSSLFQHTSATSAITSAAVHTSSPRIQGIIGSNTTYTSGSVGFRDLNGITWQSTTGQSLQITHALQYTSNTSAITSNALNTSQSSLFRHTSADSQLQFTSQMSDYLGTDYTTHTHVQSNQTIGLYGSSQTTGESSSSTIDARSFTIRGAGIVSVGLSAGEFIVSATGAGAAQTGISSVALSDTTYTSGQISFRDGNGLTWASTTGQGISLVHGLQHTSATSAITSNALNTSQSSLFQHTSATSAITSNAVHTSAARIQGVIGSNTTYTSGSVGLRDLNGITWQSTTGQSFQITHALQYTSNTSAITSNAVNTGDARIRAIAASDATYTSGSVTFRDGNGITWASTTGQQISITHGLQHTSATSAITSAALHTSASRVINLIAATNNTAGGTASLSSNVSFSAANGVTFYTSAGNAIVGSVVTSYRASNDAIGLNTAQTNVTWTVNSSGLSLNAAGYAGTGTTFNGANITGAITQNSAGLNLSLSVAAPGAAAENNWHHMLGANTAGNTTASGSTIGLSGINLTLSGTNNSVVNISAPATSSLSATGLVSLSTNGSTISIGVPGPMTLSGYNPFANEQFAAGQVGQATLGIKPLLLPNVEFDRVIIPINFSNATNSSGSQTMNMMFGIYTRDASTLSLLTSVSRSVGVTNSGTVGNYSLVSGIRLLTIPLTMTLTEGVYYFGILSTTTSGGANATFQQLILTNLNSNFVGHFSSSHNTSYQFTAGLGHYSVAISTIPNSLHFSVIRGSNSNVFRAPLFMLASSTV